VDPDAQPTADQDSPAAEQTDDVRPASPPDQTDDVRPASPPDQTDDVRPQPPKPAAPPAARPASDPTPWGRVDEDGAVWVRTADGERPVGSFPGATPEEALAYFGRKYDELLSQVELLEQRVQGTDLSPGDAQTSVERLSVAVIGAQAVGDLDGLRRRLDELLPAIEQRRAQLEKQRARKRAAAHRTKERIVGEAEALGTSSDWKVSGDKLRTLLEDWKRAPRLERGADDALWQRFSAARTTFDKRRRQHFAALDAQRQESQARKERLIDEAEKIADSREWGPTGARFRDLMKEWKTSGRARRDIDDQLWARFRAAQDRFFEARKAVFAERDAELTENLAKKEALAEEAERMLPVQDLGAAKEGLRRVQERWESIGHVPRDARERVEGRLRRVEQALRDSEESRWRRSNPEARARAEGAVDQLQAVIAKLESDMAAARASGDDRRTAEAEAALVARRSWLVEAEKTRTEFS
jgi:hypothetical protein